MRDRLGLAITSHVDNLHISSAVVVESRYHVNDALVGVQMECI
jgi:hypothetical protein